MENKELHIGQRFTYNGIEFVCLDIYNDEDYLAMTIEPWYKPVPFDTGCRNNWRCSTLRQGLNTKFINFLDKNDLILQKSNLIADNGDIEYGTSEDYITILSCGMYRKYRNTISNILCDYGRTWTLTPLSPVYPINYVRTICPEGYFGREQVEQLGSAFPVVLFSHKALNRIALENQCNFELCKMWDHGACVADNTTRNECKYSLSVHNTK